MLPRAHDAPRRSHASALARGGCAPRSPLASIAPSLFVTVVSACSLFAPTDQALLSGDLNCPVDTKPCDRACTALSSPATGCAQASCDPCSFAHASTRCALGACALATCDPGWASCDGDESNGCEYERVKGPRSCDCQAIRFDDDRARAVVAGDRVPLDAPTLTSEAWFRIDAPLPNVAANLLAVGEKASVYPHTYPELRLEIGPDTFACTFIHDGPWSPDFNLALWRAPMVLERWYHLACVLSPDRVELYLDGTPRVSAPVTTPLAPRGDLVIGAMEGASPRAAKMRLGPMRLSRGARYAGSFTPGTIWPIDAFTIVQYLTKTQPFFWALRIDDEARVVDGLDALSSGAIAADGSDVPCE